jgi:hypothetical protein
MRRRIEVFETPGAQIVQNDDPAAETDEGVDHVRSQKARSTRDQGGYGA